MEGKSTILKWLGCFFIFGLSTEATERQVFLNQNDEILHNILRSKNGSADPCVDFKHYFIGIYEYDEPIRQAEERISEENMSLRYHSLFEQLKNGTYQRGSVEEMVFKLYNTCQTATERGNHVKLIQPDIDIPWPQYTRYGFGIQWPKERFQWLVTLARLNRYGMDDVLLKLRLKVDPEDHSKYMVVIKQATPIVYVWFSEDRIAEKLYNKSQAGSMAYDLRMLAQAIEDLRKNEADPYNGKRLTLQQLESQHGISLKKYLEIVFERQFEPSFQLQIDDVRYLVELNKLLSTYNQETVIYYLMDRFEAPQFWPNRDNCAELVRSDMFFGSLLLFEEHVLGEKKVREYQSQIPQIFKAIIKSFKRRLERNRLNLPLSQISAFLKFLDGITINVGSMPLNKDHRSFVMDYYADLNLDDDDTFDTMRLKLSMLRTRRMLEKLDQPVSSSPFGVDFNTINIPYTLLAEPLFMTRGHEVFKFNGIGNFIARQILAAFHSLDADYDCKDLTNLVRSLDDLDIFTNKTLRCVDEADQTIEDLNRLDLVILSLIHDAYFSKESGFDLSQPFYTDVPLKELFFLQYGQRFLHVFIMSHYNSGFNNILPTMPAFAETFNCSRSS